MPHLIRRSREDERLVSTYERADGSKIFLPPTSAPFDIIALLPKNSGGERQYHGWLRALIFVDCHARTC
jgi:hypothetical protein